MFDVRAWALLLVAIGIVALVWLNRVRGPIPCRALTASMMAAVPGGCFLTEMWLLRGDKEPFSLITFGPALVWIVIGFIALIKSFNLWPLSLQFPSYQILRILNASVWAASSFMAWLAMILI
jgi:hypothetical protein